MAFDLASFELPPGAVLVEDDDWVVVNKPSSLGVHGGDPRLGPDLTALVARRSAPAKQRVGPPCFSLDAGTSGLVAFPKSARACADWASAKKARPVLSFLALVETRLTARRPVAGHGNPRPNIEVLQSWAELSLVRVRTALTSPGELRAALGRVGLRVVGDFKRGAHTSWRLMLHLESVEATGIEWPHAAIPPDWDLVRTGIRDSKGEALRARLGAAIWRRRALIGTGWDAFRLVNAGSDGLEGVAVDRYGDWVVLSVASDIGTQAEAALAEELVRFGARGVYVKRRAKADLRRCEAARLAPDAPCAGEPAPKMLVVREGEVLFRVRIGEGLSSGLFVDQRDNRMLLAGRVKPGQLLLNLFAYTCSFSVVAALGGCTTTSVDLASPALEWGKENFVENGLEPSRHDFVRFDARKWMQRAGRERRQYHWVVLDPPSFSTTGRKATFSVARDYGALAGAAFALLEPGGTLLAVTNHRKTSPARFREVIEGAARAAGRRVDSLEAGACQVDCPPIGQDPFPSKSLWARVV